MAELMSTPTNDREAEIKARLAAATPWPWVCEAEMRPIEEMAHYMVKSAEPQAEHPWSPRFIAWLTGGRQVAPNVFEQMDRWKKDSLINKGVRDDHRGEADAQLIANAPSDIAWLLSRIEELAKERDTLAAAVRWAMGEEGEFPSPPDALLDRLHRGRVAQQEAGAIRGGANRLYWWRSELRERAFPSPAASPKSAVENPSASSSGANTP